jgi:carbonic anhydrase
MEIFNSRAAFFDETVSNVPLATFIDSLKFHKFWSYPGSLTTPPCTEGVKWTVLKNAAPISPAHLDALNARYADDGTFAPCSQDYECSGGNNR